MSTDLDYLRSLDHRELAAFLNELQPDASAMSVDEVAAVLADLDRVDADGPAVVLAPVRRAA
ncbi:MAG: hypothetical protein JXA67_00275 [Micromonosporaceae bacterium]|nr:hypothetical protein [Micromonosporaceae bacterium]